MTSAELSQRVIDVCADSEQAGLDYQHIALVLCNLAAQSILLKHGAKDSTVFTIEIVREEYKLMCVAGLKLALQNICSVPVQMVKGGAA